MDILRHPYHYNRFRETFDEKLNASAPHAEDSSEKWCQFKMIVTEAAKAILGPKKCEHQDWFSENDKCITQLLHEKSQAYVEWKNDPSSKSKVDTFRHLRRQAQKGLYEMKDHWQDRKADEVQKYAYSNNSRQFFRSLKTVYGPSQSEPIPVLSAD